MPVLSGSAVTRKIAEMFSSDKRENKSSLKVLDTVSTLGFDTAEPLAGGEAHRGLGVTKADVRNLLTYLEEKDEK